MTGQIPQSMSAAAWGLARAQHWVITRSQLLAVGFTRHAIDWRVAEGRLHPVHRGVYAVGRPQLSRLGELMAAVLACPEGAVLSHGSAAELWRIGPRRSGNIELSVAGKSVDRPGLTVHRRRAVEAVRHQAIPVTAPITTIVDIAPRLTAAELETAINQADYHRLATPEQIWRALPGLRGQPGVSSVRALLGRHAYVATHTELERLFVPIARRAGLAQLLTQQYVNGRRVDFYCPDLGIVVETDGGLAHRSPIQQTEDRAREHAHFVADLVPLRFTHAQVRFEPAYVQDVLEAVATRRRGASATPRGPGASSATGSRSGGSARA
jgi:very-short-patch-repair endonuclease